jgi:hypothetical protein
MFVQRQEEFFILACGYHTYGAIAHGKQIHWKPRGTLPFLDSLGNRLDSFRYVPKEGLNYLWFLQKVNEKLAAPEFYRYVQHALVIQIAMDSTPMARDEVHLAIKLIQGGIGIKMYLGLVLQILEGVDGLRIGPTVHRIHWNGTVDHRDEQDSVHT